MYFANAIIDESTVEVNILAIVNCDTGMINAVIDLVTGEQKTFRHLILDEATRRNWDPTMCSEVERLIGTGTLHFILQSGIPKGKKVVYLKNCRGYTRPKNGSGVGMYCCQGRPD